MTFEIAKKIAYAASELDWLKKDTLQAVSEEAAQHINILHECAIELAGHRAREIYTDPYDLSPASERTKPENSSDLDFRQAGDV